MPASAFGRAILADRLAPLGELGLIDEAGTGVATVGQAPRLVQFCKERARIVVITLNQSALGVGIADLSGQLLTEHHEPGDLAEPRACIDRISALMRWIISRSGHLIGGVIATLASMQNPSLIVLAGSVAQTNDILLAAVRETVNGVSHPPMTRDLRIVRSQMGASAALLGAASIAVEALFTPSVLRDWIMSGSPVYHPEMVESLASANRSEPKVQSVTPPPPAAIRT